MAQPCAMKTMQHDYLYWVGIAVIVVSVIVVVLIIATAM